MKKIFLLLTLIFSLNTPNINTAPDRTHFFTAVVVASAVYYFHNEIDKFINTTRNNIYALHNEMSKSFNKFCRDINKELNQLHKIFSSFKVWPSNNTSYYCNSNSIVVINGQRIPSNNNQQTIIEAGQEVIQDFSFTNLTGINAWGVGNVVIECNPNVEEKLTIIADKNVLEALEHYQSNATFNFGPKNNIHFNRTPTINYIVYIKNLNNLQASGNLQVNTNKIIAPYNNLMIKVSGNTNLESNFNLNNLQLNVSGNSDITLTGSAKIQKINIQGNSTIKAKNLETETTTINASGCSDASVWATHELNCAASGCSDIKYYGNPKITKSKSGCSTIKQLKWW